MPPRSLDPEAVYPCGSQIPDHSSHSECYPTQQGIPQSQQHTFSSAFGAPIISGDFLRQPFPHDRFHGRGRAPDTPRTAPRAAHSSHVADLLHTRMPVPQRSSQAQVRQPSTPASPAYSNQDDLQLMPRQHSSPAAYHMPYPSQSPDNLLEDLYMLSPMQDGKDACPNVHKEPGRLCATSDTLREPLQEVASLFGSDSARHSQSSTTQGPIPHFSDPFADPLPPPRSANPSMPAYAAHVDFDPPLAHTMHVTPRLGGSCMPVRASYPTFPSSASSFHVDNGTCDSLPCTPPAGSEAWAAKAQHAPSISRKRTSSGAAPGFSSHVDASMSTMQRAASDGRPWRLDFPPSVDVGLSMTNLRRVSASSDPSVHHRPHTPVRSVDTRQRGLTVSPVESGLAATRTGPSCLSGLSTVPNSLAGSECLSEGSSLMSHGATAASLPPMTAEAPVEVLPSCPVVRKPRQHRSPRSSAVPPLALPGIQPRRRSVASGNPAMEQVQPVHVRGRHSTGGTCVHSGRGGGDTWRGASAEQLESLHKDAVKLLQDPYAVSTTPRSPSRQRQCRRVQTPRVNTAVPLRRRGVASDGHQQQQVGCRDQLPVSTMPNAPSSSSAQHESLYQGHGPCARTLMQAAATPPEHGQVSDTHTRGNIYMGRGDMHNRERRKSWKFQAMDKFQRELRCRLAVQGVEDNSPVSTVVGSPGICSPAVARSPHSSSQIWQQAPAARERSFGDKIRLEDSTLRELAACMQKGLK